MPTLPICSIIVTCYNYEKFVAEALDSVSKQTYRPLECIVVNDASSDRSLEIIREKTKELENLQNGITYVTCDLKQNGGQLKAIQEGLKLAKGAFVCSLDADDVLFPDFISAHIHAHLQLAVGITFNEPIEINEQCNVLCFGTIACKCHEAFAIPYLIDNFKDFNSLQTQVNTSNFPCSFNNANKNIYAISSNSTPCYGQWLWYPMSAAVFRTAAIYSVLNVSDTDKWRISADWLLFALAHFQGGSCWIPQRLSAYRRHGNNGISKDEIKGYYPQLLQHKVKNQADALETLPLSLIACFKDTADKLNTPNKFYLGYINAILYEAGPQYMWRHRKELKQLIPIFNNPRTFFITMLKCIIRHKKYKTPTVIQKFSLQ